MGMFSDPEDPFYDSDLIGFYAAFALWFVGCAFCIWQGIAYVAAGCAVDGLRVTGWLP